MKRKLTLVLAVLFALATPIAATAMSHEKSEHDMHDKMKHEGHGDHGSKEMDHSGHDHGAHDGMAMEGDMVMLGDATASGVKAMAHLKDVSEAMSKMGMETTHHIMVMFADTASGKPIEEGVAAVKITGPDGKTGAPIKLMGMQGHFGADVTLAQKGEYTFEVGTKLKDGEKRQFTFNYTLK